MVKILKVFGNFLFATAGVVIVFLTVYLFGWDFLSSYLVGNDIAMAQVAASWFDHYFPNIPQWFPLHGMGVSMFQGTQILAPIITVVTSRILPINLVQSLHLWEFLAVYLTALGIAVFVRVKFKNWPAAILAGIFYPLSNASWAWLAEIGLYANAVSFIFYAPTLLALDFFLSEIFGKKRQRRLIFWFFSTSLLAAGAILTHFTAGTVLFEAIVFYAFVFSVLSSQKKLGNFFLGLGSTFLILLASALLSGFWLFPFLRYSSFASRNLLPTWSFEQIPYTTLGTLFGFKGITSLSQNNGMWYVFFSRPIWILAVLGIILAFLKKNKTAIVGSSIFVFFVFYAVAPGITPWLVKALMIFWRDIYVRSLIPAIIFLPILAAWGCLAVGMGISGLIFRNRKVASFVASTLALIIAFLSLFFLKGAPPNQGYEWPCYQGFGRWWRTGVDYCHFWDKLGKIDFRLSSQAAPYEPLIKEVLDKLDLSSEKRVDISPKQGALIGGWSNMSQSPIVSLYWYPMSLNNKFWGYEQEVLYNRKSIEPFEAISELASWFGINYVFLHRSDDLSVMEKSNTDPFEKFVDDYWEEVLYDKGRVLEVKRFKKEVDLATWTDRPTILVLGNIKKQAYEQVFRKATIGALPYSEALLVEGRDDGRLDKYTLEDLKKFDGLILYGQVYEDKAKVDKLLTGYVKGGGRLYIESGWQYTNSEWQTHQALEVIPLKKFEWDQGPTESLEVNSADLGKEFDPQKFGKFIYYNDFWSVTTAPESEVKNWGEVILKRNSKPIVVIGSFGQGKVVWSGMNLFGHLQFYASREEYNFTHALLSWLFSEKENRDLKLSFSRPNPDKILFTFNEGISSSSSLLWRENFYPDWRATLTRGGQKKDLKIYRAGPNEMLFRLPTIRKGDSVELDFKLTFIPVVSRVVSLLVFVILSIFLASPKVLTTMTKFCRRISSRLSSAILEDKEE